MSEFNTADYKKCPTASRQFSLICPKCGCMNFVHPSIAQKNNWIKVGFLHCENCKSQTETVYDIFEDELKISEGV